MMKAKDELVIPVATVVVNTADITVIVVTDTVVVEVTVDTMDQDTVDMQVITVVMAATEELGHKADTVITEVVMVTAAMDTDIVEVKFLEAQSINHSYQCQLLWKTFRSIK